MVAPYMITMRTIVFDMGGRDNYDICDNNNGKIDGINDTCDNHDNNISDSTINYGSQTTRQANNN
eukprot:6186212-Lingulodinium_polyedra.AAC.1